MNRGETKGKIAEQNKTKVKIQSIKQGLIKENRRLKKQNRRLIRCFVFKITSIKTKPCYHNKGISFEYYLYF